MNILKKEFKEEKLLLILSTITTFLLTLFFGFDGASFTILTFTILTGSGIISKEKEKIDFLFSKPVSRDKIFLIKFFASILFILILFLTTFITMGLIIELRRICFAGPTEIIYFYEDPSLFIINKKFFLLFLSFVLILFSVPLFFSILTFNTTFSFVTGIVTVFFIETLAGIISKKGLLDFSIYPYFYSYLNLILFIIFTFLSYFSFKKRDFPF